MQYPFLYRPLTPPENFKLKISVSSVPSVAKKFGYGHVAICPL